MSKTITAAPSYEMTSRFFIQDFDFEEKISFKTKKQLFLKRVFDIVVSLLVITFVLSWLLPILAILIKINSRGPVFFVQKRVGAFGTTFNCYKLRTMYVNNQANSMQAETNDPRITSTGRFLRLSCLDELPQFFNVLMGDMSVVGPRPHMIKDCNEFSKVVKQYKTRELVKPGITGIAQVKGYRGKTTTVYDVVHRYKWDVYYIKNCSFSLDMKIVRLTITSTLSTVYCSFVKSRKEETEITYQLDSPEYLN